MTSRILFTLLICLLLLTGADNVMANTTDGNFRIGFGENLSRDRMVDFRQGDGVFAWTRKEPEPQGATGIEEKPEGEASLIQALWRSAVIPGWGEKYLGANRRGAIFFGAEVCTWGTWGTFKIQEKLRRDNYIEMARNTADVVSDDHTDEYWKIVGQHLSSEEYNVWLRDFAAREYGYGTSEYTTYINDHNISATDGWQWNSADRLRAFVYKRQASLDAERRATYTLYALLINRVVSMVDVWRLSRVHNEIAVGAEGEYAGLDVRVVPEETGLGLSVGWYKNF